MAVGKKQKDSYTKKFGGVMDIFIITIVVIVSWVDLGASVTYVCICCPVSKPSFLIKVQKSFLHVLYCQMHHF